ncbi:GNAT family N-acetyltransferase [Pseudoalteromonas sp. S983]|uniref:GNAT family N-acetyltransferase n=1 Tax=Pseudoalteromonas sp. S983 TaxID=579572 RepID=UPI00110ABFD6|nr:GNAT family N-acetyltransferase [Pseudoalteromonas sp. S983]TMP79129.1 N-acetyltransferase [Pseudoalteromonas sp. S983]
MINSKTIKMRYVEEADAEFILKLRLDERYNQFLSEVKADLESQKNWIRAYKKDELDKKQFYFIIERLDGTPCGTVRIYGLKDDSFSWGSWILNEDKTRYSAIESALMVYEFGFNKLKFNKSHFEVMKDNIRVVNFHKKFGAQQVSVDNVNYYFSITKEAVQKSYDKFKGIL